MKVRIGGQWVESISYGKDGKSGKDGKDGLTPVLGVDYFTPSDQQRITEDVLKKIPAASELDFSSVKQGYFSEKINGEIIEHAIETDENGRPTKIDNIIINW